MTDIPVAVHALQLAEAHAEAAQAMADADAERAETRRLRRIIETLMAQADVRRYLDETWVGLAVGFKNDDPTLATLLDHDHDHTDPDGES